MKRKNDILNEMSVKPRYIHLASFAGNIGDVINHTGFYDSFDFDMSQVEQVEMRRFYKNCHESQKLSFDNKLLEKINKSKMLILGGGGFFDVYWNDSNTGTTINMPKEFIDSITVPVLVNAMGVHFDKRKKRGLNNFFEFFTDIKRRENWFISIRNDGSLKRMQNIYGNEIIDGIQVVPDNGFMVENRYKGIHYGEQKWIGLSITNELLDPQYLQGVSLEQFNLEIGAFIAELLQYYCCIFFLHGPQDFSTLMQIQNIVGREAFRNKVIVAPYFPFGGKESVGEFLRYYSSCDVVVGMRFHSNVVAIANNIPVIGLAIHEQISDLFEEINLAASCVRVGEHDYINRLRYLLNETICKNHIYKSNEKQIMHEIRIKHSNYKRNVEDFIECQRNE